LAPALLLLREVGRNDFAFRLACSCHFSRREVPRCAVDQLRNLLNKRLRILNDSDREQREQEVNIIYHTSPSQVPRGVTWGAMRRTHPPRHFSRFPHLPFRTHTPQLVPIDTKQRRLMRRGAGARRPAFFRFRYASTTRTRDYDGQFNSTCVVLVELAVFQPTQYTCHVAYRVPRDVLIVSSTCGTSTRDSLLLDV
jgi:hypothetical protein